MPLKAALALLSSCAAEILAVPDVDEATPHAPCDTPLVKTIDCYISARLVVVCVPFVSACSIYSEKCWIEWSCRGLPRYIIEKEPAFWLYQLAVGMFRLSAARVTAAAVVGNIGGGNASLFELNPKGKINVGVLPPCWQYNNSKIQKRKHGNGWEHLYQPFPMLVILANDPVEALVTIPLFKLKYALQRPQILSRCCRFQKLI